MSNKLNPKSKPVPQIDEVPKNAVDAAKEIDRILFKYGCKLSVSFSNETVMGQDVLVYIPTVIPKK